VAKLLLDAIHARLDALEKKTFGHVRQRWSKRQLAEHEGCSTREVMRRVARGIYAQPEVENNRVYFWSDSYRRVPSTADTPAMRAARNPQLRPRKPTQTSPET
jgi:hypothetical protein